MTPSELPTKIGDRYRTIRVIGRGGMGVVYEVEHEHTGERLALKLLLAQSHASGDTVNRFKREARASARIKSEHVVRVTDAGVANDVNDSPFIVMELLDGTDLDHLTGGEAQPAETVVDWLRQVARALDKAHRLGIVHRDLKPENIFLAKREDGSSIVKILDFGIVKMLAEKSTTQGGQLLGTPMYMAPEQINRDGTTITGATDRYALGLIAYKLLVGRHYREGEMLVQVVADVMRGKVVSPSSRGCTLGKGFDRWFKRACHPEPEARFPTAGDQIEELASVLGLPQQPVGVSGDIVFERGLDTSPTVEIESNGGSSSRFASPRFWWAGTILATLVIVAFTSALLLGRSQRVSASSDREAASPVVSDARPVALRPISSPTEAPAAAASASAVTISSAPAATVSAQPAAPLVLKPNSAKPHKPLTPKKVDDNSPVVSAPTIATGATTGRAEIDPLADQK
jgi:serine/threonine-protein kinase